MIRWRFKVLMIVTDESNHIMRSHSYQDDDIQDTHLFDRIYDVLEGQPPPPLDPKHIPDPPPIIAQGRQFEDSIVPGKGLA